MAYRAERIEGIMILKPPKRTGKLLTIAFPCFVEQLLVALMGIISTMIVGHLGRDELTAATMSNTIVNWLQCVYTGLATGSTVIIARMWGSGDKEGVKQTFMQSVFVNTGLGIFIMLFLVVFQEQAIHLLFSGAEESVKVCMRIYFRLAMIAMPATALCNVIAACLRGVGDNKTALYYTSVMNILNVLFSYGLIYGVPGLGIPALGITGAGIALVIARYLTVVIVLVYVIATHKPVLPERFRLRFDKSLLKRVLNVGIPSATEQFIFNGGFVILQSLLVGFGTVFQAAYQVSANFNGLVCVPSQAMNVAMTALTGQALGRENYRVAKENVRAARFVYATVFSVIGILVFLFAKPIAQMYTDDAEVVGSAVFFIRVFAMESFAVGYFQTMTGVLRGAGDTQYLLVTNTVGLWLGRLCATWVLAKYISPYWALAIGLSLDFYTRAVMYHFRVEKGKWMEIKV